MAPGYQQSLCPIPRHPRRCTAPPMLIISGMSGAGKSTALKALEDLDYEAVDNLPLGLVETLLASAEGGDAPPRPLAFGIDTRTRAFDAEALAARLRALRGEGVDIRLIYLDCADDELVRRFSETRRRHPLAADRPAADGVVRERESDRAAETLGRYGHRHHRSFGRPTCGAALPNDSAAAASIR